MKYLLNVTFYAGSNDIEDTDKGLYLLNIHDSKATIISEATMLSIFKEVNRLCNIYSDDEEVSNFPVSYEDGLNITTLMKGIAAYTNGLITELTNAYIDNPEHLPYYYIEQWQ